MICKCTSKILTRKMNLRIHSLGCDTYNLTRCARAFDTRATWSAQHRAKRTEVSQFETRSLGNEETHHKSEHLQTNAVCCSRQHNISKTTQDSYRRKKNLPSSFLVNARIELMRWGQWRSRGVDVSSLSVAVCDVID